ncbi:MAG: penicillin acylase family protein, partial [Chloroflexota bacterium]|nr:penicillin acylase family protein [Chloroflexota bacterium]
SELAAAVARAAAPASWRWAIGAGFGDAFPRTSFEARVVSQLVARLREEDHGTDIAAALGRAVATLRERFGTDPAGWAWGTVRPLRLLHPLGVRPPFDRLFNLGPVPLGGDANTVAQAGVRPLEPLANPAVIANHRTVIDLADPERSRYIVAGGQSGNPLSPHYADLFELWQRGDGVPIAWSHDAVVDATVDTLLLRPLA